MAAKLLDADERELWHAWKIAGEAVMARVVRDISAATSLSGPDFAIVSRLEELGDGELRQQELADALRWDKSRLSHQLTRMEGRRLVARHPTGAKGVLVVLTRDGKAALAAARPVHAASIRRHLIARLGPKRFGPFLAACRLLAADDA